MTSSLTVALARLLAPTSPRSPLSGAAVWGVLAGPAFCSSLERLYMCEFDTVTRWLVTGCPIELVALLGGMACGGPLSATGSTMVGYGELAALNVLA